MRRRSTEGGLTRFLPVGKKTPCEKLAFAVLQEKYSWDSLSVAVINLLLSLLRPAPTTQPPRQTRTLPMRRRMTTTLTCSSPFGRHRSGGLVHRHFYCARTRPGARAKGSLGLQAGRGSEDTSRQVGGRLRGRSRLGCLTEDVLLTTVTHRRAVMRVGDYDFFDSLAFLWTVDCGLWTLFPVMSLWSVLYLSVGYPVSLVFC